MIWSSDRENAGGGDIDWAALSHEVAKGTDVNFAVEDR